MKLKELVTATKLLAKFGNKDFKEEELLEYAKGVIIKLECNLCKKGHFLMKSEYKKYVNTTCRECKSGVIVWAAGNIGEEPKDVNL